MPKVMLSPFVYGPPVSNSYFINREEDLRYIFGRLLTLGQSTAITGEPHVGKTSLLFQLCDPKVQKHYLGTKAKRINFVYINLYGVDKNYTPKDFWGQALENLEKSDEKIKELTKRIGLTDYSDKRAWEVLFRYLIDQKRQLVLLLDEFDVLLPAKDPRPNFGEFSFFAILRDLDAYPSFSFITTSRTPVKELNHRASQLPGSGGSQVFNTQVELKLRPFDDAAIALLLGRAGDKFSNNDKGFIRRIAGRNPFLLQALCGFMLDENGDDRIDRATEKFFDAAAQHFEDLWNNLDDNTKTTSVILSLAELNGQAQGRDFSFGEIEHSDRLEPELRRLRELGLAELVEKKDEKAWFNWIFEADKLLVWRGERWAISSKAFAWWVRDVVIAETRSVSTYDEWLKKKKYTLFLTEEQWKGISSTLRKTPNWAFSSIGALAKSVFEAITQKRP